MKKKGFTLIELLAVIVVLAVIALVTIPVIFKMISDSQEKANQQSVQNHIGNINDYIVINMTTSMGSLNGTYTFNELGLSNYPSDDKLRCLSYTVENDNVVAATGCVVNSKSYCYVNSEVTECGMSSNNIDSMVLARVNQIRNTPNTDISGRSGNIYYVSNDGNDSNNGLSESTPFKTMDKIETMFTNGQIPNGSTILFRNGDRFYGLIHVKANNILFGSYGDSNLPKPVLTRSPHNGAELGTWTQIKPNIWKYTYNGSDQVLSYDVGTVWFFCNSGNNNCTRSMNTVDKKFEFAKKVTTVKTYDETNLESKIDTLLKNDLEFYHAGHPYNDVKTGGAFYLYSTTNPSERFDVIEFAQAGNIFSTWSTGKYNLYVDNIHFAYCGSHGVLAATTPNLVVKNSELGFIGGALNQYNSSGEPVRYGNGVMTYGAVMQKDSSVVTDGFVVENSYIYQVYDAGLSFQYTSNDATRMEKVRYKNNVIEYNNYNIEYWNVTNSTNSSVIENTYIKDVIIEDNIMRYPGVGVSETRPNRGESAHLKTWNGTNSSYNIVKGTFIVRNNTFDSSSEQFIYLRAAKESSLPVLTNNTFYGSKEDLFGYYFGTDTVKMALGYDKYLLSTYFPNNNFIVKNDTNFTDDNGTTGDVNWSYLASTGTLKITGTGAMANYTSSNLAPWYKYKDKIYNIEVGENVTKLGNYTFYNLTKVINLRIDSKTLSPLSKESANVGNNYTLYHLGHDTKGTTITFGSEVTRIPEMLSMPTGDRKDSPNTLNIIFEGNKITRIDNYAFYYFKATTVKIPEGVTRLSGLRYGTNLKFAIFPDTLVEVIDWSIFNNYALEKLVYGPNIGFIGNNTLRGEDKIKILVIPHINNTSTYAANAVPSSNPITIYGDSSTEEWINNTKSASGQTNITYKPLSEYVCTITSNTGINTSVGYDGTYTFTTSADVEIKQYYDASDGKRYYVDADYTKSGNTYTITKIKSDIEITIK